MFQDWLNKLSILVIVVIAFVDGILVAGQWKETSPNSTASEAFLLENILEQKNSSIILETVTFEVPPFTSQAPYGIWDEPWTYFAEEASTLMVSAWAKNATLDDSGSALLELRNWETANLGTFKDTDLDQTLRVLKEYFNVQAEISYDVSREALLSALDQGKILLVPVNGQTLGNPHYGEPGPGHHMILVYGYEGEIFLTNDPGTVRGESYPYPIEKILGAIQDLNGEDRVIVATR